MTEGEAILALNEMFGRILKACFYSHRLEALAAALREFSETELVVLKAQRIAEGSE